MPNSGEAYFSEGNSLPAEAHPRDSVHEEGNAKTTICSFSWGKPGPNTALQGARLLRGTTTVMHFPSKPKFSSVMADCALLCLPKAWWPGWNEWLILPPDTSHVTSLSTKPLLTRSVTPPSGPSQQDGWGKSSTQQLASGWRHMLDADAAVPCTTQAVLTTSTLVSQVYQPTSKLFTSSSMHWRGVSIAAVSMS